VLTIYNFTTFRSNRLFDLTISGQYVLIYGDYEHYSGWCQWGVTNSANGGYGTDGNYWPLDGKYRRPIELWKLNSSQSVPIPLPDHKLYLTEDEQQKFFYDGRRGSQYYTVADTRCNWLLDPSSTPKYLVGIVTMGLEDQYLPTILSKPCPMPISGIVLVFDQLNDPQFLRRLVLPFEGCEIKSPRLLVAKGVEQTALVIEINKNDLFYVSDLAYDFQEITGVTKRSEDLSTGELSYDGEDFIFKKFKQPVLRSIFENTDFTGNEPLPACLAYHIRDSRLRTVADTRLLWNIYFTGKCKDHECQITKMVKISRYRSFKILVEQDFLICSGDGQGTTSNRS